MSGDRCKIWPGIAHEWSKHAIDKDKQAKCNLAICHSQLYILRTLVLGRISSSYQCPALKAMLNIAESPLYLSLDFVQYLEGDQQLGVVAFLIRPILEVLC